MFSVWITKLSWKLTRAPTCPKGPDRVATKEESVQSAREGYFSRIRVASLCISFTFSVAVVRVEEKQKSSDQSFITHGLRNNAVKLHL